MEQALRMDFVERLDTFRCRVYCAVYGMQRSSLSRSDLRFRMCWDVNRQLRRPAVILRRGCIASLSSAACEVVLEKVEKELAQLPLQAECWSGCTRIRRGIGCIKWVYSMRFGSGASRKGYLMRWTHRRVLRLLRKDQADWPIFKRGSAHCISGCVLVFPFEEQVVLRLNERLQLRVESTLPYSHSDMQSETLGVYWLKFRLNRGRLGGRACDAWVMESAEMLSGLGVRQSIFRGQRSLWGDRRCSSSDRLVYGGTSDAFPSICHCGAEYVDGAGCCSARVWAIWFTVLFSSRTTGFVVALV